MSSISLEILSLNRSPRSLAIIQDVNPDDTILQIKRRIVGKGIKLAIERQSLKVDVKGKSLNDGQRICELNLPSQGAQLFLKDLGPQIAWKTVFLAEYAGPLFIYPIFFVRPLFIYGNEVSSSSSKSIPFVIKLALICWLLHYSKRLYETLFIHRFSNSTMPAFNLLKNCLYYWGFCAFVSYFVNHPLYTSPIFGSAQITIAFISFILCELGNYSIHVLLRDLRPEGTKQRNIPYAKPNNPFTLLFNLVSCPNYTYEVGSWLSFSIMTQSLPALIFTIVGFVQMTLWAQTKHRSYKRDFECYPKERMAIIPYLI